MKNFFLTIAALTVVFILPAHSATWYVATSGNDSGSCSAAGAPCSTINSAYQKASGGDTIQLAAGTYGAQTISSASKASTVIVQPATGASVTLGNLTINGATQLEFRNLTTRGFMVNMNSNYITLRNVDVAGWLGYTGGSNVTMIGGSVGPVTDAHPQIAPSNGWQGQGVNFVFDGVNFHDITRTSSSVHTECLQVAGTTNMVIRNSIFQRCDVFDLSFTEYNGSGKVTNLLLENNFFATAGSGGYFSVHFTAMNGGTVRFNSATQAMMVEKDTASNVGTMTVIGNNVIGGILDGNSGGCLSSAMAGVYQYNVTQGWKCGATDVNAAPGFVNASTLDLRLLPGSAAIDLVPLTVAGPPVDIDGKVRPQGSGRDAGASEYAGVVSTVPNPATSLKAVVQ